MIFTICEMESRFLGSCVIMWSYGATGMFNGTRRLYTWNGVWVMFLVHFDVTIQVTDFGEEISTFEKQGPPNASPLTPTSFLDLGVVVGAQ